MQTKASVQHHLLFSHAHTMVLTTSNSGDFSNASNFKSAVQSAIDPRTGTLSCGIVVGQLDSNWGKGPFDQLTLNYTSGASENFDNISTSWRWNIPHYNLKTQTLTTENGRTFLLTHRADGTWGFRYHKLKDAVLLGSPQTGLILTLKIGIRDYF